MLCNNIPIRYAAIPPAKSVTEQMLEKLCELTTTAVTGGFNPEGSLKMLPGGEIVQFVQVLADGTRQYFYFDGTGELQMSTASNVGANTIAPKTQLMGTFGADFFANGADLTITTVDLIDAAIAAGTTMNGGGVAVRDALPTDFISRIDVDLKPIGGHVDVAGVQITTTASDAKHTRGGGVYDIDPGGSSSIGELVDPNGFRNLADNGDIIVKAGSGVVISFDLSSIPA